MKARSLGNSSPLGFLLLTGVAALLMLAVATTAAFAQGTAAEGIPAGTPATGVDTGNTSDLPDLVRIAATDCTVTPGASVTLEDGDGTQAELVDGQRGITITANGGRPEIRATDGDFVVGDNHATFPTSDTAFDPDGDYTVAASEGIQCRASGTQGGNGDPDSTPAGQQYDTDPAAEEDVIVETVPEKPLPQTGGFGVALGAALTLGAAALVGSRIVRDR